MIEVIFFFIGLLSIVMEVSTGVFGRNPTSAISVMLFLSGLIGIFYNWNPKKPSQSKTKVVKK